MRRARVLVWQKQQRKQWQCGRMNPSVSDVGGSIADVKASARRDRMQAIALAASGVGVVGVRLEELDEEDADAGVPVWSGNGRGWRRSRPGFSAAGGSVTANTVVLRPGAHCVDHSVSAIKSPAASEPDAHAKDGRQNRGDTSPSVGAAAAAASRNQEGPLSEKDEPTDLSVPGAHWGTYGRGRLAAIKASAASADRYQETESEFLDDDDPLQETEKSEKSEFSTRTPIVAEVGDQLPEMSPSEDRPRRRTIDPTIPYSDLNLTDHTGSSQPQSTSDPVGSFPHFPVVHEGANGAEAEEGLAVATVVDSEHREEEVEVSAAMPTAYVPNPPERVPFCKTRRCRIFAVVGSCMIIIAVVAGSVVGAILRGNSGSGSGSGEDTAPTEPTSPPTAAPTPVAFTMTVPEFLEEVLGRKIKDAGTPYKMALEWIMNEDPMNLTTRKMVDLTQRYLLAVLYFSTIKEGGDGWTHCGRDISMDNCTAVDYNLSTLKPKGMVESVRWLSGADTCEWMGIKCEGGGTSDIILIDNNLHGTLVPELTKIEALKRLSIIRNTITGTIPTEYGSMERLLLLELNRNTITGSFPAELHNMASLRRLNLAHNSINGTLPPPAAGSWPKLDRLTLFNNTFTGPVPSELGNLHSLTRLYLSYNRFAGSIPSGLGNAQSLEKLCLQNNFLNGTVPPEICGLGISSLTVDLEEVQCECCNNACS